jgi:hypothetical protein
LRFSTDQRLTSDNHLKNAEMVGEVVDPFYLTEGSYEVKLPALKGGASREGRFVLYCAPCPRRKGRSLRGTSGQTLRSNGIVPYSRGKQ